MKVNPLIHGCATGVCVSAPFLAPNPFVAAFWGIVAVAMVFDGVRALYREFAR